jgi:hypothetical protein
MYLIGYNLVKKGRAGFVPLWAPNEGTVPRLPSGLHRHERSHQKYRPDAGEPALWRQNPLRRRVPLAAVHGKKRCRMHGGASGSGAPKANRNARKHGLFIQALLVEARKLLEEMK